MLIESEDGRRELLLIEWKLTKSYGSKPLRYSKSKTDRCATYKRARQEYAVLRESGPAFDLHFFEPTYQLLRKQLLAAAPVMAEGEPEHSAGIWVERVGTSPLAVFGTVLPWRGDTRHDECRGGGAFRRSIELQAVDWTAATRWGAELRIADDLNEEYGASGPVRTRAGREALDETPASLALTFATGEPNDPLRARGWRRSIDHVLLSRGLCALGEAARVWPNTFPLPKGWPDHHVVALTIAATQDAWGR